MEKEQSREELIKRIEEELKRMEEKSRCATAAMRHAQEESRREVEGSKRTQEEILKLSAEKSRRLIEEFKRTQEEKQEPGEEFMRGQIFINIRVGNLEECRVMINELNNRGFSTSFNQLVKPAVEHDREEILDLLIEKGAEISPNAVLSDAIKHGSKRVLDYLLSKYAGKVDIDHQDEDKNTALHHALQEFINAEHNPVKQDKYKNFVESLLGKGAKLDVKNNKNETPFDLLIDYVDKGIYDEAQRLTFVSELLSRYENKNALKELKYKDGTPALNKLVELAVKHDHEGILDLLVKNNT